MVSNVSDFTMFSIRATEWRYRAEGNGNIVLSLHNKGQILRLVKTELAKCLKSSDSDQHEEEKDKRKVHFERLVSFGRDVIAPVLGSHFVHPGEVVLISGVEIKWLNSRLFPLRPEFRRREKTLAEEDSWALLFPDHCALSPSAVYSLVDKGLQWRGDPHRPVVVAIEIKPKMGFIPTRSTNTVVNVCKYHLMQLWKLKHKRINKVSEYCPLDLFSGCRARMTDSIRQLIRNPQNNLRIFLDGSLVYGENLEDTLGNVFSELFMDIKDSSRAEDHFCNLVVEALLFDHSRNDVKIELCEQRTRNPHELCGCKTGSKTSGQDLPSGGCYTLPKGCILNRLLTAQKLYPSDARSLVSVYEKIFLRLNGFPIEKINDLLYGPESFLDVFLEDIKDFKDDLIQVRNYLLSCTAKDCSLIITFCQLVDVPTHFDGESLERASGAVILTDAENAPLIPYLCTSAFVDLDWKPLWRVPKHASEEDELEKNFLR